MLYSRKASFLLALIMVAGIFLCSCATPEGFLQDPSVEPSATELRSQAAAASTPSPTPEPTLAPAPTSEEVLEAISKTDVLEYIPADTYTTQEGERWYEPVIRNEALTLSLPEKYSAWINAAVDNLDFENVDEIKKQFEIPSWPMLAAIAANYRQDPKGMRTALVQAGGITSTAVEDAEKDGYVLEISARPADPNTLFYSLPESTSTNAFSLLLSYAYLATVFDESLQGREGIGEPELEQLLFPIARPDRYFVGDTWADARDQGARRHTGTDINAPEGTDLLACVDGTIIFNGTDPVAGNYIVLQGNDGTQYHYYHMVTPSDVPVGTVVETGDVIGHVGNTGNSRANHLHFTIVTSDGHFVNPVRYLQRAQKETINGVVVSAAEARAAEEARQAELAAQQAAEEAARQAELAAQQAAEEAARQPELEAQNPVPAQQ